MHEMKEDGLRNKTFAGNWEEEESILFCEEMNCFPWGTFPLQFIKLFCYRTEKRLSTESFSSTHPLWEAALSPDCADSLGKGKNYSSYVNIRWFLHYEKVMQSCSRDRWKFLLKYRVCWVMQISRSPDSIFRLHLFKIMLSYADCFNTELKIYSKWLR